MAELHVDIETHDGTMESFIAKPNGAGPFPVIVLYMDAPGIREELRDFARRIAGQGYFCLLPDMYYRGGKLRFDLSRRDDAMRAEIFKHMRSINNALVMRDTEGMLKYLAQDESASNGAMGCIGYCMSGQYVMTAAGTFPERFKAAVSCYGVGIVTDKADSPHLLADKVTGELFFAFAEQDDYVEDREIKELEQVLAAHSVESHIEIYSGTQHGFCFPEREGMYVEAAAEAVWKRSFELYKKKLG